MEKGSHLNYAGRPIRDVRATRQNRIAELEKLAMSDLFHGKIATRKAVCRAVGNVMRHKRIIKEGIKRWGRSKG